MEEMLLLPKGWNNSLDRRSEEYALAVLNRGEGRQVLHQHVEWIRQCAGLVPFDLEEPSWNFVDKTRCEA